MKINILNIIYDHIGTLTHPADSEFIDGERPKMLPEDFLIFFLIPVIVAAVAVYFGAEVKRETFGISISVFAIFTALLLNVQIALFSVFQRRWSTRSDSNLDAMQREKMEERNKFICEININISYLILISCSSVSIFIGFYVFEYSGVIASFLGILLFLHFIFTLLMVIKRSHVLFREEYKHDQ